VGLQFDVSERMVAILPIGQTYPANLARVAVYREQ
jgi:hypothetical protein